MFCSLFGQNNQKLTLTQANNELRTIIRTIQLVHYDAHHKNSLKEVLSFVETELNQFKDEDIRTTDSISLRDYHRLSMQTAAMMSGGHTKVDWFNIYLKSSFDKFEYISFLLQKKEGKYYTMIGPNDSDYQEIIEVNSVPIHDIIEELKSFVGGNDSFREAYVMRVFPFLLFYSNLVQPPYVVQIDEDVYYKARPKEFGETIEMVMNVVNNSPYSYSINADKTIAHFEYDACEDYDRFSSFIKEMFKTLKKEEVPNLIIDIRNNSGGNSSLNDELLSYITKKKYRQSSSRIWKVSELVQNQIKEDSLWYDFFSVKWINKYLSLAPNTNYHSSENKLIKPKKNRNFYNGNVVLLTGSSTFSSANFLADAIKTYQIAPIIGEPTGENTNDYGEIIFIEDKNGLFLQIATTYDIGADGNKERNEPVIPDILELNNPYQRALQYFKEKEND
jgi:hypothetical protein